MMHRSFALLVCAFAGLAACQPDIETFDPMPVKRGQMAKVEGDHLGGVTMCIDGTPVGAAKAMALSDPENRRDIMIPANAPATLDVSAHALLGSDSETADVAASPAAGTPPDPDFTITSAKNPDTGAVTITATGTNIFPGAGGGIKAYQGPQAEAERVPPPGTFPASESTFLSEGVYTFKFDTLPTGDYKLHIHNPLFYGGKDGVSSNQVSVP